ncbi:uncharacterized protein LOC128747281 [Synchiropus splendidus]|uniref:uncharacterized protein LOC128747281 n=1 Tax=Synchiropus splendidus TaxID=270530 RepID=UPI00237DC4D4|nr:uncharacterized protein LOC128747281 [Synchiropus splendidus]XP_053701054.1 uncharacterized protein LOC128747281 [Synchiropus splendidus]XP_053701055.1 uncharacterized protein LOC128747281 [Synchiropus splendidus]
MGKPLSRPGCFRKSSCCLEKHGAGDRGMGGRDGGIEAGYGDGYVPQRSIYDTMCINQQIDNHHHHHHGGSMRQDGGGEGSFSYSASSSLRVGRSPGDMFDMQPRSLTPNPSFVRRLDERAIYDSLKLGAQDVDGSICHSPGNFNRSISPSVSSFSAPGVSSSLSKKHHHHHHHHHGDSTKSRDGRQSWKGMTPQKHLECVELTANDMIDRGGGGYLNPGHYGHQGGQSSSLTSPLISPFSGSPLSSGYHTPVFFSPGKPLPSQSQSLRCSPPHAIHPRHYSQTQSLRMSPPQELRRSPYRAPLVQLSAHDLEQDMRDRGGWGRSEREWEREKEREMERGWAQREWERERERGRLERERARERERRETTFGTFGYGRQVPLHSDSVFLEPEQVLDTTPLLLPQPSPSPSPSPNAAPRMGTGAVGRNRAGSRVGSDSVSGPIAPKYDNGSGSTALIDKSGPRLVSEVSIGSISEAEIRAGYPDRTHGGSWNKHESGARVSVKNGCETRMGSQVKTRAGGRELEGRVQSGMQMENMAHAANKVQRDGMRNEARDIDKPDHIPESISSNIVNVETGPATGDNRMELETAADAEASIRSREAEMKPAVEATVDTDICPSKESRPEAKPEADVSVPPASDVVTEQKIEVTDDFVPQKDTLIDSKNNDCVAATDKPDADVVAADEKEKDKVQQKILDDNKPRSPRVEKGSKSQKSKSSKSLSSSKASSRTRPGTATGMRPGAVSPRPNRGLPELESTGPTEGIEFTWPRRVMVRKRTVRQGGALHNLPILPPLPSVLSALEKRRPHGMFHPRTGHFSENPLINPGDPISFVGRCSLKEPSNQEASQIVVGRASLKEQNLEHWRVCREQDEPKRSKSKEKQGLPRSDKLERGAKKHEEEKRKHEKNQLSVGKENVSVTVSKSQNESKPKTVNVKTADQQGDSEIKTEGYGYMTEKSVNLREVEKEKLVEAVDQHVVEAILRTGEVVVEEVGTSVGQQEGESWDAVLEMVNTLWDDGWEKRGAGGDDTDSLPGSLQRWPLLRPPVGFGGSHPPSSAASELSLTELERRARELDSDLEHLDLSQPSRDGQDLFQTASESQKERGDMYQTHPGPQREKGLLFTGVASRSQVSLELSAMALSATNPDRSPAGWTGKSGAETLGTNSTKEDSSPDSNLTLESDSSGVFLSLSNQSQEETGSDSDPPVSGSDLGSSTTSLEKDGDEIGIKEWGREESSELQWCYPSLLNTSTQEDVEGDQHEDLHGKIRGEEIKGKEDANAGHFSTSSPHPSEEVHPRKKVTIMHTDSGLSPLKKPIRRLIDPLQKPVRTSGLDCGDIDPYVTPDSFVYLAVSAGPGGLGEIRTDMDAFTHHIKHAESRKTHVEHDPKLAHLLPDKPEEGDFLCTDSFVYLAAPDCLLLGPEGSTHYSGRDSDSESSDSGPVDLSGPGCEMVAGDSDWDSDLSDSDPSRPSRIPVSSSRSHAAARSKRLPPEPEWDKFKADREAQENRKPLTTSTTGPSDDSTGSNRAATPEQQLTKKVTWQFKPAQRSVCTGSRKEKDKEMASFARLGDLEGDGPPSPSSSSSSSTSSSD